MGSGPQFIFQLKINLKYKNSNILKKKKRIFANMIQSGKKGSTVLVVQGF